MPIAKDGLRFILMFFVAGFVLSLFPYVSCRFLGGVFILLSFFCIYFFRDPDRKPADDPTLVLAPGDGRVLEVTEGPNPYWGGNAKIIRIFLSIFDIHVQRSPIAGQVVRVTYKKGKFLDARNPKACIENEQNSIIIEGPHCKAAVVQIAGFIARRIVCWVFQGKSVAMGERLGLIRFGSQVDIFLPLDVEVCVANGDRVTSGVSVIAICKRALGRSLLKAAPQRSLKDGLHG